MDGANQRTGDDRSRTTETTRRGVLRGSLAVGAAITGGSILSGTAAAHFPDRLDVDVRPRSADDVIDLEEDETIPVAVYPTEFTNDDGERVTFDPTAEAVRYRFGSKTALDDGDGAQPIDGGEVIQTGDDDSREALLLEFPADETGLEGGEDAAWLYWERDESGEHGYSGSDSVTVFGPTPGEDPMLDLFRRVLMDLIRGAR